MSPRKAIDDAIAKLSPTFLAGVALVSMLGAGWSGGITLARWIPLRAQVEHIGDATVENTTRIAELQRQVRADSVRLARIECIVTAMATKADPIGKCGL